ncbi:hypothetical protein OG473_39300 (plasmid) [Streptomyces anulatus]|uniref:hypothetical protein n=1 Tax=Streptomyces anulatus TaxID=1892 RepID=UPI003251F2B7
MTTNPDAPPTTVLPYGPGNRWKFAYKGNNFESAEELALYAEPNGCTITDDYLADEISAEALWQMWVDEWADHYHKQWPNLYRPGEVHISWYVTTPSITGTFEGAPHITDWRTLPGHLNADMGQEDFLTHYTHPTHVVTGERLNWLRLPVIDRGWNSSASNKGGFIQEATGWKPSPLQPTMDVRQIGAAAGLYVPPL